MGHFVIELARQHMNQRRNGHYRSQVNTDCRRWFVPQIPEDTALYGLLGANVAVFLLWRANPLFAARNFTTSLDGIKSGRLHTLVTCTFSQRDTWHLVSNMIGLYFFGRQDCYNDKLEILSVRGSKSNRPVSISPSPIVYQVALILDTS